MITDQRITRGKNLDGVVSAAIEGGADVIQLRDKKATDAELVGMARELLRVTRPKGIPLMINDRPRVAKAAGAQGVHLGQDDGPLDEARALLGEEAIIGRSTHSPAQALAAEKEGFDYIGVGPVFETPTKPTAKPVGLELVSFAADNIHIPFVAIGGINVDNVEAVCRAGAKAVAVVRVVMGSENPSEVARAMVMRMRKVK